MNFVHALGFTEFNDAINTGIEPESVVNPGCDASCNCERMMNEKAPESKVLLFKNNAPEKIYYVVNNENKNTKISNLRCSHTH